MNCMKELSGVVIQILVQFLTEKTVKKYCKKKINVI